MLVESHPNLNDLIPPASTPSETRVHDQCVGYSVISGLRQVEFPL